jgi:hypothetical protein
MRIVKRVVTKDLIAFPLNRYKRDSQTGDCDGARIINLQLHIYVHFLQGATTGMSLAETSIPVYRNMLFIGFSGSSIKKG